MSIIPISYLENALPDDAENNNAEFTDAVNTASAFVNSWTSTHYDPWDNFDTANNEPRSPRDIVSLCLKIAIVEYKLNINQTNRDGDERTVLKEEQDGYQDELMKINVVPSDETITVSLDSNNSMIIENRTSYTVDGDIPGIWSRVIPKPSSIQSSGSTIYTYGDDFWINRGGSYDDEYTNAWYLRANTSTVEGTLRYKRSFRNDYKDYLIYK